MAQGYYAHPSSDVSPKAIIGHATKIWQMCQVREGAVIGDECILGKSVYVDSGVRIGCRVKIQNGVSLYEGVILEDGVFCGPHCVFTNDLQPRAINPDGTLKNPDDWTVTCTRVGYGAAIGANAVIVCGSMIGRWAMVGSGSIVTHDVPDNGLVYGNPARLRGFVCACGQRLEAGGLPSEEGVPMRCPQCGSRIVIPISAYLRWERENQ